MPYKMADKTIQIKNEEGNVYPVVPKGGWTYGGSVNGSGYISFPSNWTELIIMYSNTTSVTNETRYFLKDMLGKMRTSVFRFVMFGLTISTSEFYGAYGCFNSNYSNFHLEYSKRGGADLMGTSRLDFWYKTS